MSLDDLLYNFTSRTKKVFNKSSKYFNFPIALANSFAMGSAVGASQYLLRIKKTPSIGVRKMMLI